MKNNIIVLLLFSLVSCGEDKLGADQIIENSIQHHGGVFYDSLNVNYTFREKHYNLKHSDGLFSYKRTFKDSTNHLVEDVLNNEGFYRIIEDEKILLSVADSAAYANSVNSVHYFALLPYGLNSAAVITKKLENTDIKNKEYYTVKVTFQKEGGGTDFEDEFVYWFDIEDYSMDFMAYSYHTEGGGVRFREAFNPRKVQGVTFQDYYNYKADKNATLHNLHEAFEDGRLNLLSKIELDFIKEK